jgi:hypothetical protein
MPAGCILPAALSSATLAMLTALQLLPLRRGVNRLVWTSSSTRRPIPSIQPKQSASSTASG